jgi:hypothetical protein
VSAVAFGLETVIVKVALPSNPTGLGENDFAIVGGDRTVRLTELLTGPVSDHCAAVTPPEVFV